MHSLAPSAPPVADGAQVLADLRAQLAPAAPDAVAAGVDRLLAAQLRDFPDTCFADYHRLAADLWAEAAPQPHPLDAFAGAVAEIDALYAAFGQHGPVRFRYVHDFLYGYDWVKFCRRTGKSKHPPFSAPFRAYMLGRADAIREGIDQDSDSRYPQLDPDRHRNITGFCREPTAEAHLWPLLRERDLLPFAAWECTGATDASRDIHALRETCVSQNA